MLLNVLVAIGCIVWGFLLGSIPTGVVIGKVFFGKDPREFGSHNSGGTNTGRVLGKKVGMTQIFNEDGALIPVTVLTAGPCVVTQVKTVENDGYSAVQVGFADKKDKGFADNGNHFQRNALLFGILPIA